MVFNRKKKKKPADEAPATLRGRDGVRPARKTADNPLARRFADDEPDTVDLEEPPRFAENDGRENGESTTRLLSDEDPSEPAAVQELTDPVAGFLVVIGGHGKGSVLTLGYGINPLGRDESQRIAVNFGDSRISRRNHCLLTYDSMSGKFYIQPGEGRNLAYLDNEPVLAPGELTSGQHIRVGSTELRFVALCGADFKWEGTDREG